MEILFSLIILILSAIIHEYMHGWMANELGDPTAKNAGRLTLNPLAHIDPWGSMLLPLILYIGTAGSFVFGYAKPVPYNPFNLRDPKNDPAKVAAAGPLSNFVVAIMVGMILRFIPIVSVAMIGFLQTIVIINLLLMVINLIPIPPLDGSKIIFPFLPLNIQSLYMRLEQYGLVLVLLVFTLLYPLISYVINFFYWLIVIA